MVKAHKNNRRKFHLSVRGKISGNSLFSNSMIVCIGGTALHDTSVSRRTYSPYLSAIVVCMGTSIFESQTVTPTDSLGSVAKTEPLRALMIASRADPRSCLEAVQPLLEILLCRKTTAPTPDEFAFSRAGSDTPRVEALDRFGTAMMIRTLK